MTKHKLESEQRGKNQEMSLQTTRNRGMGMANLMN